VAACLTVTPAGAQTTGLVPLTDLGAGTYAGFTGGLYPGSANTPPAAHLAAALARAGQIVPRDASGNPSASGWVGMIAIGMSNTTHEFGAFERNADADTTRNARVVILDTGLGGQTATTIANPHAGYWTTLAQRLAAMGLTAAQVQVAWLKEAEAQPPNNFPLHAQALRDTLKVVARNLHDKFPNLQICYVSSRIYGGYTAQGTLNPEPQAYESGFSVKWLIEDQINGDPGLNHDPNAGVVRAPLLFWGPYLWADGMNPRSDGLTWLPFDLESDRVHPSAAGEQKVAGLLADFFAADPTAAPWWPAQPGERLVRFDAIHDSYVDASAPTTNFGGGTQLLAQGGAAPLNTYLRFDVGGESRPILLAKLSARVSTSGSGGGAVLRVDDVTWDEASITWDTSPPIVAGLVTMPQSSRDGTIGANVTGELLADADGQLSFALTTATMGQAIYASKEGGQPPRLVLVVANPTASTDGSSAPRAALLQVTPNPSRGVADFAYELPQSGPAEVNIHAIDGRRVRTLIRGWSRAGLNRTRWDGRDANGREAGAGLYLIRIVTGAGAEVGKFVLVR
jgi:hypothetical protein